MSDVEQIAAVNKMAASSRTLQEFEAVVLPVLRTCFDLSVCSLSNRRVALSEIPDRVVFCGVQPQLEVKYQRDYRWLRNPVRQRVARADAARPDGILDSQDVFEDPASRQERLYQVFHKPSQMERSLAVVLRSGNGGTARLGLWRSGESRGFDSHDFLKLRCVTPVLVNTYGRLSGEDRSALDLLSEVLEPADLRDPLVVLDNRKKIIFANAAGEAAMAQLPWGRLEERGRAVPIPNTDRCGRADRGQTSWTAPSLGSSSVSVRVIALSDRFGRGYLLRLSPLSPHDEVKDDGLDQKLSQRELEVARAVAQGLSTKRIAQELSLSVFTVQDHIKALYRKTGVNSRVGLARLVMDHR
jgi:DNA-binding CsgD family transcriptional regulator